MFTGIFNNWGITQAPSAPAAKSYYTIDARGTDPVAVEQRVKASLKAVHSSAVQKSFQAQQERTKRTPQ